MIQRYVMTKRLNYPPTKLHTTLFTTKRFVGCGTSSVRFGFRCFFARSRVSYFPSRSTSGPVENYSCARHRVLLKITSLQRKKTCASTKQTSSAKSLLCLRYKLLIWSWLLASCRGHVNLITTYLCVWMDVIGNYLWMLVDNVNLIAGSLSLCVDGTDW